MDEFSFIANHLAKLAGQEALELKDDIALWSPPKSHKIITSMDSMAEGVHFPQGRFNADLAYKLLAVNISDLTAKAVQPCGYLLSLSLGDDIDENALSDFVFGLAEAQKYFSVKLWGGDTIRTNAKTVLTITIFGTSKNRVVLRSGAKAGDLLCVSGNIGDAYLGLQAIKGNMPAVMRDTKVWKQAYDKPEPPIKIIPILAKYANAALDISDGLIADARHLVNASGVGAEIYLTTIPLSSDSLVWILSQKNAIKARADLASGGDDYQVLFSIAPNNLPRLQKACAKYGVKITTIGKITKGAGVACLDSKGKLIKINKSGFKHF